MLIDCCADEARFKTAICICWCSKSHQQLQLYYIIITPCTHSCIILFNRTPGGRYDAYEVDNVIRSASEFWIAELACKLTDKQNATIIKAETPQFRTIL